MNRILVFSGDRVVDLVDEQRAQHMARGQNAKPVRARKTGKIVRINLREMSNDFTMRSKRGNPRRYSHDHETDQNPRGNWTLRNSRSLGERTDYERAITDCQKAA